MRRCVLVVVLAAIILGIAGCGQSQQKPYAHITKNGKFNPKRLGDVATPAVGDVFTVGSGQWSGSPTGFAYAWKDCDSNGANCTTAAGSPTNSQRYQVVSGDTGFTLRASVTASYSGHPDATVMSAPTGIVGGGTFPLQVSSNGRYLQTAGGSPFLVVGDSPQSLLGDNSVTTANSYLDNREAHGFNAVWVNLLCDAYTFCASNGQTYDSVAPFTSGSNPSGYVFGSGQCGNCNSTYFSRAQSIIGHAQADNIAVFLDPISTDACNAGDWYSTLTNNGDGTVSTTDADYRYGEYLGNEFKAYKNVVWQMGNDFTCYTTSSDDANLLSVANGIEATDPGSPLTLEECSAAMCGGGGNSSEGFSSLDDTTHDWTGVLSINESYTYAPTYAENGHAYGQTPVMPVLLGEANYENESNGGTDGGAVRNLRLQEWWTMTSGGAGSLYGNAYTVAIGCNCSHGSGTVPGPNTFNATDIDTTGVTQLGYQTTLLTGLNWQNLKPDTGHLDVWCGSSGTVCGSCPTTGSIVSVTCVTDAVDSTSSASAHLGLVYLPDPSSFSTVTVDLSKFAGSVTARWYDPTNGSFTAISGSPFTNSGTHNFTPGSNNSAGDKDWVLVLQA